MRWFISIDVHVFLSNSWFDCVMPLWWGNALTLSSFSLTLSLAAVYSLFFLSSFAVLRLSTSESLRSIVAFSKTLMRVQWFRLRCSVFKTLYLFRKTIKMHISIPLSDSRVFHVWKIWDSQNRHRFKPKMQLCTEWVKFTPLFIWEYGNWDIFLHALIDFWMCRASIEYL